METSGWQPTWQRRLPVPKERIRRVKEKRLQEHEINKVLDIFEHLEMRLRQGADNVNVELKVST